MRKQLFATAAGFAVAAAFGVGAAAQTAPPATPPQTTPPAQAAPDRAEAQQVKLVGCVQREADYRQANNLGKGGAVGTSVGVANEFVLINATATGAAAGSPSATGTTTGTATGTATGTSGATAAGQAFEVTGENESKLGQYVGQRVEITGTLKKAEVGPAGATGGATAGKPPTGVDVTSADLRLREVEIVSVKTTTGTCPTK